MYKKVHFYTTISIPLFKREINNVICLQKAIEMILKIGGNLTVTDTTSWRISGQISKAKSS